MSLSYHGTQRTSWSRDYGSGTSSASSRPLTSASSSSSVRSRVGYGSGSSNIDSLDRRSHTSNTSHVSAARRLPVFTPTSSLASRSYSKLDETPSRLSGQSSGLSHGISTDKSGRRDSHTDLSPTASYDVSSSYYQRVRSHPQHNASSTAGSSVTGDGYQASSSVNMHRRSQLGTSSSVDPDQVTRKREGRSQQERLTHVDNTDDLSVSNERRLRRRSYGHRLDDIEHVGESTRERAACAENRLQQHADDKTVNLQGIHNRHAAGATRTTIHEVSEEDQSKLTGSLCGDSLPVNVGHTAWITPPESGDVSASVTRRSAEASADSSIDTFRHVAPAAGTAGKSDKPHADCPEKSLYTKNTSFAKKYLAPEISEYIMSKSNSRAETAEVSSGNISLHCEEDYSRKSRTNTTTRANSNTAQAAANSAAANAAKAEIIRLESLCEARTKELTHTKMQLRATGQAFDAMAVLVNYCCADLKAFECPLLANNLQTVQKQLTGCLAQIADLNSQKDTLENTMTQVMQEKEEATRRAEEACDTIDKEREDHKKITREMDDTHNAALTTQRDELTSKHDENVKKLTQFHDRQIDLLRLAHERQISDMKNENKLDMNALKISHLEEIQELRNKHDSQMEELHKQHRNKLEDITHRFEAIKLTLSEKLESLRGECDELARRARNSEDALQRDADAKVQIALAPYLSLPKEIESLKTVLEMRNEEVQKLRSKNMDFEKQLEEIPMAREKIISLQQKVENLEAIINIKTDHEKQLHEKCQILMRKYDRESRANKRLSMDYEQVVWRMSQSSEFGSSESLTKRHFSRSPPRSKEGSPDTRQRAASPVCGQSDVIMRVKKRSSHSISEGDRKLRSRSETFVVEKTESSDSHSPSLSPQLKLKRWRKKSQANEAADTCTNLEQMCHSAGADILPDPCRQHMQSSSLSLNDVNNSNLESSDLADSYGRSSSGVSDSGMCDSISRSDVLDCSIVSTDSEWGTSVNLSKNCDSTLEDLESGPEAGDYHSLNNITMIEVTGSSCNTGIGNICLNTVSSGAPSSCENRAQYQHEDHEQSNNYHFSITLPQATQAPDDSAFDNNANSL